MSNLTVSNGNNTENITDYNSPPFNMSEVSTLIDDIVLKNYVTKLTELDIVPLDEAMLKEVEVQFFKINEMVYAKEEYATYKFAAAFSATQNMDYSAVFIIAKSNGQKTDFYMGVRSSDPIRTTKSLKDTLKNALSGQFPGIKTENLLEDEANEVLANIKTNSIASVSCVANNKDEGFTTNQNFLQGLEKMTNAMSGRRYTAIIVANGTSGIQLNKLRKDYEDIYTQLSPFANMQFNYGSSQAQSLSQALSSGITTGSSHAKNTSATNGTSDSTGTAHSTSKDNLKSRVASGVAVAGMAGVAIATVATGGAAAPLITLGGVSIVANILSTLTKETNTEGETKSHSINTAKTTGETISTSEGTSKTNTETKSHTNGTSNNIQYTKQNKRIINILERIDLQLKRLQECESLGMWECAAYFLSDSQESAEMAASTYKALMKGDNSGVEISAVNCWGNQSSNNKVNLLKQYITNFIHPVFSYIDIKVTPASLVSSNELAIHMGLPRKSVCGLPVIEYAEFGKEIICYDNNISTKTFKLGKVFNMGSESNNPVRLSRESLTMHTFITGSTGSGKSNTVYEMLKIIDVPFLVIEPAKGEYKNIFGHQTNVTVLGTNSEYCELLKINPFRFTKKTHIFEHVDRLMEIFNVCWPMYAAMPAVLKDAVLQAYEACGWDLVASKNSYSDEMFPTFADLQYEIMNVIESSAYSQELKSNYIGSLATRIKSLTNGLNGQIFSVDETDNNVLFDSKVIVDLSRIGSLETKSLIMGILIMRLKEHRMCFSTGMNLPLKHITVLEEAHNILKRTSTEQNPESSNMVGKSVEMLANSIAEMRTYGEGFIIVDQSPSAVDISAIRNTNTKIVMRLPDEADRRLAGKASGLNNDEQLNEIAKLPKGVAVVYQNDWREPVLCKINHFDGDEKAFKYNYGSELLHVDNNVQFNTELIKFLLKGRVSDDIAVDTSSIEKLLNTANISTKSKLYIRKLLSEYYLTDKLTLWQTDKFSILSKLISELLGSKTKVDNAIVTAKNFDDLNAELQKLIESTTLHLPQQIIIAICQAFMRQNSERSQDQLEIYSAWRTSVENGGVVR